MSHSTMLHSRKQLQGLEHHESSEDGVGEKAFADELELIDFAELMGHEYVHSWNGKYRRPAGLATPDFDQPMRAELLWVYEGLTQYLGKVLPVPDIHISSATTRNRMYSPK